ncbi:MAG TPA: hypothetical protein VNM87_08800, partial [Candidatus Udaeobacter sp.]|nr:hypothetical protein [Candidatus Udaeobacter sp.]
MLELLGVQLGVVLAGGRRSDRRRARSGCVLVQHHLAPRQQDQLIDRTDRALAGGIELAQGSNLIAVELDPHRIGCAEGEDVDDAAAPRDIA